MGPLGEGEAVDRVHLLRGQRQGGGILHHRAALALLDEGLCVVGVGLLVNHTGDGRELHPVACGLAGRRKLKRAGDIQLRRFFGAQRVGRAAYVPQACDFFAGIQAGGYFPHLALAHPVNQQVGLGVQQHALAHLVGPVVVMGEAAHGGLDAAYDYGCVGVGLAGALRIDYSGPVRAQAGPGAGRKIVGGPDLPVVGVLVDHRIHVPGRDAEEQAGSAEHPEIGAALPARLCQYGHPQAFRLEDPADQRHGERRMVHIGVAGDQDDVYGVPAPFFHLFGSHRKEIHC